MLLWSTTGVAQYFQYSQYNFTPQRINPDNLRQSGKPFNRPSNFVEVVDRLHAHGIAVYGCFVFGMDEDTTDVFNATARFAVDARIDLPRFAIVTPFPGTPLHARLAGEGRLLTRDWSLYDGQHVVFQPARMTPAELQSGTERAWRHAYSVPSMVRRLRGSPAPIATSIAANLGYRHYGRHLHRFYNCDWVLGAALRPAAAESP
jgi:radical SAM superfamily enzyme YgiQ (UPF0313 family)